jgi:hypothetical protein
MIPYAAVSVNIKPGVSAGFLPKYSGEDRRGPSGGGILGHAARKRASPGGFDMVY